MDAGSVCIIVLNRNGKQLLDDCLNSIDQNTHYDNYEVVVVDNDSSDGSLELLNSDFPDVNLIANDENLGFSIANNQAIHRNQNHDWYLLLNNDTEVHRRWLTEMLSTAKSHDSAGIVGAKLLHPDGTIQHAGGRYYLGGAKHIGNGEPKHAQKSDTEVIWVSGAAFLISSDVFQSIGYLDEAFSPAYSEDIDYCARARAAGYKIYRSADAVVTHKGSMTAAEMESKFFSFIRRKNRLRCILLNGPPLAFVKHWYLESRHIARSILHENRLGVNLRDYKELAIDFPDIYEKRNNRASYIPSYYCEGIKNYMSRYN